MNRPETQDEFDRALTKALQRVDAPPDLLRFLTAAAQVEAQRHLPRRERAHRWAWYVPRTWRLAGFGTAFAALVLAATFAGEQIHQRHQQQRADEQFLTAVRITDHALDHTRAQLLRAGIKLSD